MPYSTARPRLVSALEATVPLTKKGGAPAKFKHDPRGSDLNLPDTRGFFIVAGEDADEGIRGPYCPGINGQPLVEASIRLSFAYRDMVDRAALDELIESDRVQITQVLGDPTKYQPEIQVIRGAAGGDILFPARRKRVNADDATAVLLSFSFMILFRS